MGLAKTLKLRNYLYLINVDCELTEEQKNDNRKIARERIFVENAICGMKRYRVLSNKLRTHLIDLYDLMLGVCAGLWNFYLAT